MFAFGAYYFIYLPCFQLFGCALLYCITKTHARTHARTHSHTKAHTMGYWEIFLVSFLPIAVSLSQSLALVLSLYFALSFRAFARCGEFLNKLSPTAAYPPRTPPPASTHRILAMRIEVKKFDHPVSSCPRRKKFCFSKICLRFDQLFCACLATLSACPVPVPVLLGH